MVVQNCAGCSCSGDEGYACRCLKLTVDDVVAAIQDKGCRSIGELKKTCGAGDGCMSCHVRLRALLFTHAQANGSMAAAGG